MSKSNQRRLDCLHEAAHAVVAWLHSVPVTAIRLVPDHEEGELAAITRTVFPRQWTAWDIASKMRITLAGPFGELLGPAPVSQTERDFAKWERTQHIIQAMQFAKQFGAGIMDSDGIPHTAVSAEQDVVEIFKASCVTRAVKALARRLASDGELSGLQVSEVVSNEISESERDTIVKTCCVTGRPKSDRHQVSEEAAIPASV